MDIDAEISAVLAEVKVLELSTITRDGGLNTRPMSSVWFPETRQIVLTTPVAYPQKAMNVRRDGRVALLYSDFAGSGLAGAPAVLVQGTATVPEGVATPQDLREFWRGVMRKSPALAEQAADAEFRRSMDWYFWRLPFYITPERVRRLEPAETGGSPPPPPGGGEPMAAQIADALERYPTAVFAARDEQGYPQAARAVVTRAGADGALRVRPVQQFAGAPGAANLLWHRHDGGPGEMSTLLVTGSAGAEGGDWTFVPERIPGALPLGQDQGSHQAWIADARQRSLRYLERRGMEPPELDWKVFTG
ncbi:pyridoxamine 5'-phosphate oxidase family protein [Amycolatopsis cihanbeyliensis]|uniref:Pyridoxamine 5'-phosphate oxidase n=1 Tax=Amycolatopsis cihanbeyliensis TaxID=1128664 RepID=A0A542DS52_AMYCI|nr:pyridoxamine 5'-phosphate oxidase family protein [Amycolatopsis cihanbeyliensis]TQJ05825.1 pyridoxamine 5'-phosphate oxidase [Amycolatopsis cihanbeyliensis]